MFSIVHAAIVVVLPTQQPTYDPLNIPKVQPEQKLLIVEDEKRNREVPVKLYLPEQRSAAPVVLFSHGLGGTREGSAFLGKHWASRGYVAVFLQHPGSDDSAWRGKPLGDRMGSLKQAASAENFQLRVQDVKAVLDQLEKWNSDGQMFGGRFDLKRIGMSGHSFGAVTTQAVSGQKFPLGRNFTDPRIKAAVIMSPSGPRNAFPAKQSFSDVSTPWMLMTGTKDDVPIFKLDASTRLAVFPALPPGDKYELILENAEHSVFTERRLPDEKEKRNPNHHRAILAISTAFWDAILKGDASAKAWLNGEEVRKVLDSKDQWKKK